MKKNKTKIICTIGPSSDNFNTLKKMKDAGMDIIRINMSYGNYAFYKKIVDIAKKLKVKVMMDTKGPEIRVGTLSKPITIKRGSSVTIKTKCFKTPKEKNTFYVFDSTKKYNMAKDLKKGDRVLVDDGKLHLVVTSIDVNKGIIITKAWTTHTIETNKRINLPDSDYSIPFLSETDKKAIIDSAKLKVEYIALSFVNTAKNILDVRKILNQHGGKKIKLIAKIETQQGIDNIKSIIKVCDGVMVARGDLGLETPYYDIPYQQIKITKIANKAKKMVIVATQMLDSLENSFQPTRSEVTDVFFAVMSGADSTMLSGETANGLYPVHSVEVMAKINAATEKRLNK